MEALKPIANYDAIVKIFYQKIKEVSELPEGFVLNKSTANGADLIKVINDVSKAYAYTDSFLLFDVSTDTDSNGIITTEKNNTVSTIADFKTTLNIYGNSSFVLAQKILARFQTEETKSEFREKGIWVKNLIFPETVKEFVNNTLWVRQDIRINFTVRFNFNKLFDVGDFASNALTGLQINTF